MRLLATYWNKDKSKSALVYRDTEWDEYRVKFFDNGKHLKDADYHTDNQSDAMLTAAHTEDQE